MNSPELGALAAAASPTTTTRRRHGMPPEGVEPLSPMLAEKNYDAPLIGPQLAVLFNPVQVLRIAGGGGGAPAAVAYLCMRSPTAHSVGTVCSQN